MISWYLTKVPRYFNRNRLVFSMDGARKVRYLILKKPTPDLYFQLYTKINSKWVKDLHIRVKTMKLLGKKDLSCWIRQYFSAWPCCHFGLDHSLLGGCSVHCRIVNSIPDLCPLDASSIVPVVTIKNSSRHYHMYVFLLGGVTPGWELLDKTDVS